MAKDKTRQKPNRLINEKSPYLLQHAYNPVEWYPWGEEAFKKARRENKPIFLSIGYSTCHWCQVMEKESFSNPETAKIMNKYFVCIKLDREERPDIDTIYMTAVQSMTGSGGWPLNIWLTPDLKPIVGGTYFPPTSNYGITAFPDILLKVAETWQQEQNKITETSTHNFDQILEYLDIPEGKGKLDEAVFKKASDQYTKNYDAVNGGFGDAPKFPMPTNFHFLQRYAVRTGIKEAREMSLYSMRKMAEGGIFDQIGGGFHRYSTDRQWHIPHFEKMLYDNAQLAVIYINAYRMTKDEEFAETARNTLDYILRDMTHEKGGFFSAEDADSIPSGENEKKEGAFYLWEKDEITKALGAEAGNIFSYFYGVESEGNAESDPRDEFTVKNILYKATSIPDTAKEFKKSESEITGILKNSRIKLLDIRAKRARPGLDDKILTSWNGLMISACAHAGQTFGEPRYIQAAEKAAQFIKDNLYDKNKKFLFRRWHKGSRNIKGMADDYAFLIQGIIDLYETTFDSQWLSWAEELTDQQIRLFFDKEKGGFFTTAKDHDKNFAYRIKDTSDNVIPSASSVSTLNLLRLSLLTERQDLREKAEKTLTLFADEMHKNPLAFSCMLSAFEFYLSKPVHIIIAGKRASSDTQKMLREVHRRFLPNKVIMIKENDDIYPPKNGIATAYICINYACSLPTTDIEEMNRLLDDIASTPK